MSLAAFVFAAISFARVATGAFVFERGDAEEEKGLDRDHKETISDHERIIGEREKETAEHRNEVSASKKDTANSNDKVNGHSKKMGHRRTKRIGHRLENNIAHRKKTEQTGDPAAAIAMDIDSWTQSAPMQLNDCTQSAGASVAPLSSSSPLAGATLVEEEKSDDDETAFEDDDESDDAEEDGTEKVVDVLQLSGQALKLEVAERKRKRAYISLGSDGEKARSTAKDANAKAMTARLSQSRAQRKAGIAAFKMVEALTAEKEAKAAKGFAKEAAREADTADKKFMVQESRAKAAAKKALRIAKMGGRLWEKAREHTAESVAKSIKDLEEEQAGQGSPDSAHSEGDVEAEKKASAERIAKLKDAAREEMEKAALLKAKAAEVGNSLIGIATPPLKDPIEEVVTTTVAPMQPPEISKAMKKYCGPSAEEIHKQPFSTKGFYEERALPPADLSSMSGL